MVLMIIKKYCFGAHSDLCLSFTDCEIRKNESELSQGQVSILDPRNLKLDKKIKILDFSKHATLKNLK